jgi:hypothetical protein
MRTLVFSACVAGILSSTLNAQLLLDNTSGVSSGADCVDYLSCYGLSGQLFDSFTSSANTTEIIGLNLVLTGDGTSSGAVQVGLYADSSTQPGAFIVSLGTLSDNALFGGLSPTVYGVDLTASGYPNLAPNTRYWIGLSGTTAASWSWSLDSSGVGVANEFFSNPTGTFDNSNGPYQMSLIVGPEPSSFLLIAAGAGLLSLLRRRSIAYVIG